MKEIYFGTFKFSLLKIVVAIIKLFVEILVMAIFAGIGALTGAGILMIIGLILCIVIEAVFKHFIGYIIKAGHVAAIAQYASDGYVQDDYVKESLTLIKERYAVTGVFFVLDKLVNRAVRQVQRIVGTITGLISKIPGLSWVDSIVSLFINIFLNNIDECCFGWTLTNPHESAFKTSCDGIVIYFQNAKKLCKRAVFVTLVYVLSSLGSYIVFTVLLSLIFTIFMDSSIAVTISLFVAIFASIGFIGAFIEPLVLCGIMQQYMEVALETEITFDLYGKLCKASSKFKELFGKACQDDVDFADEVRAAGIKI